MQVQLFYFILISLVLISHFMLVGVLARNQYHNTIAQSLLFQLRLQSTRWQRSGWFGYISIQWEDVKTNYKSHWTYNLGASSVATFKSYLSYAYITPGWLVTTDPLLSVSINFKLMYSNRCEAPSGIFNPFILLSCFSALYLVYISYTEMCCMFSGKPRGKQPPFLFFWVLLSCDAHASYGGKIWIQIKLVMVLIQVTNSTVKMCCINHQGKLVVICNSCGKSFLFCACRHLRSPTLIVANGKITPLTPTLLKTAILSPFVVTCYWLDLSKCCGIFPLKWNIPNHFNNKTLNDKK